MGKSCHSGCSTLSALTHPPQLLHVNRQRDPVGLVAYHSGSLPPGSTTTDCYGSGSVPPILPAQPLIRQLTEARCAGGVPHLLPGIGASHVFVKLYIQAHPRGDKDMAFGKEMRTPLLNDILILGLGKGMLLRSGTQRTRCNCYWCHLLSSVTPSSAAFLVFG